MGILKSQLAPLRDYIRGYKVYTALLTQEGVNAPTANVLENTIGDITFSRENVGLYHIISPALFIEDKTTILVINNFESSVTMLPTLMTNSDIQLYVVLQDDVLGSTFFEIKVYL